MRNSVRVFLLGLCLAGTAVAAPQQSEEAARDQLARFAANSATLEQWKTRASANREGILRGAGLLPSPAKCPLNPIIHSRRTYDGYTVESVAFESLTGFYVTGSLYRPTKQASRYVAILCPHGHFNDLKTRGHGPNDQGGRFNPELQKLPATLARMGAIAFAYDMVGWSDSTQTTHDDPNVLALQLWNSIRTVDFLLSLRGVDPKRLGVTGASGGGTQTMMLTAVDDRIAAAAPVVMVSAHFFGGCRCESGMPIHQSDTHETNNADISAMAAPRPQLIVSCGADWTKNVPEVEFPYIRNVYRLFRAEDRVANAHFAAEGHDYGPSKRQAVYKFFAHYFKLALTPTNETGIVIEDIATMRVFNDQHPRPATAIKGPEQIATALQARPAGPLRLVIIGDSTVCDYPAGDPCRGWGQFIQASFNDTVRVINLAKSGRSTKTFIKEGLWDRALNEKPDIILIQFGHNDSHGPGRPESTDAATDYRDYLRRYIREARAAGATPILVTPMHRRTFDDAGKLTDILRPYADAMKAVATEQKVPVTDLHTSSGQLFERLGPTGSAELANKPGDHTHFNEKGARAMAELVIQQLPRMDARLKSRLTGTSGAGKSEEWYRSTAGQRAADNIVSWQSPAGSWPKNMDPSAKPFSGDPKKLQGTFDNGATTGELHFLAQAFRATKQSPYEQAFLRGLDTILKAQYPTGGWPQYYPPPTKSYHRHITFNDNTMVRLMELLRAVVSSPDYEFVDADRRLAAQQAFDRGIECILKCQVVVNGKPTVWCAQHDESDYRPRPARSYELVSLSGGESVGILALLMSLDHPSAGVIRAIQAGAEWYETAKLTGIRQVTAGGDKRIIKDPAAPPLWARFYEIETNRPIFSGRDGVTKHDIAQIEAERRNGYAWYGNWGERVARDYAKWKAKWTAGNKP